MDFDSGAGTEGGENDRLDLLLDIPLDLCGVGTLGCRFRASGAEPGSVVELDKVAGEPLDI